MANHGAAAAADVKVRKKKEGQFSLVMKRLSKNKVAMAGLVIILILFLAAILAPYIIPYGYDAMNMAERFASPSLKHLCGTDEMGRDIFSRLLYGGRASLSLGFLATIISTLVGMFIGSLVGYFGGVVDTVVMRFVDILQAIPGILLAIAISACLGSGFVNTIIALSIGGVPMTVRLLRGSIMGVRKMEYLEAAQTINCSVPRLIIKHILPNSISPIIVSVTMGIGNTILMAASLSYIGLGVQPPTPEWGAMLSAARTYMRDYPHMVLFPGLAIAIVVLSLNMLGDGLRDALDPKLKQ
ncbi:MAG TPA: ABC transporter permease [Candidatus Choladousia intestinigallinarum]|nr:ABC transporter permease [Candidatus Choladousia intestinigallinarum]